MSSPFVCLFVQEYLMIKAAFLAFGGQLRTTSAEDFHKRERGGGERGRERGEREGERERERERGRERDWHLPRLMLTLRKLLSRKGTN